MGFSKFLTRARNELVKWFGPYCNHDPTKIAFMAAREWDGMDDSERKFFIRAQKLESRMNSSHPMSGSNSYICFLLHKRYAHLPDTAKENENMDQSFNPKFAKLNSEYWRSMPEEDKQMYSNIRLSDVGIEHVIKKRDKLHEMYQPIELSALELILKTRPKRPMSPRMWFFKNESLSIRSPESKDKWLNLGDEDKEIYSKCALLDKKRFTFEKSAWITKLLAVDFEAGNFTLSDFENPGAKSRLETIGSMVELSRDLPQSLIGLRRPKASFALFVEANKMQIQHKWPKFQFGRHLKECSEAWAELSEEERQSYKEASKRSREARKQLLENESNASSSSSLSIAYFSTNKSIHGPCRPSHLIPKPPSSAMAIWAKANNIKRKDMKVLWDSLSPSEKDYYEQERERLKKMVELKRVEVGKKLDYVKSLMRKAKELEELKRRMRLISSGKS